MPDLLGFWGEIQPACCIFPVGIPPTMSQASFSVFNFSFKKNKNKNKREKEVAATGMNGAQCVPVCTCSTTRKWTLQLRHVCDFSTALAESWIRMGQSHILQQMFFPLRKWQVLKSAHCGSDSGKLIKAALRRAAGWVKARKLQTPFATHFASTYIFNPGLYTSVPLHHWLKLLNTTMGMGIFYQ